MTLPREVYSLADLRDWRTATDGCNPPIRLAVFGDPVAHSASPPMHNAALAASGIDARYGRIRVHPDELAAALRLITVEGFVGVNLTIPHKAAALPLLDDVDEHGALLGVVNTVRVSADGKLHGSNTDGPGFVRAVQAEFGVDLGGQRILILGAGGGAGRALAAQCMIEGCDGVVLVNRTIQKAQVLANEFRARFTNSNCKLSVLPWEVAITKATLERVDMVVNASSVGLKLGDASPLPAREMSARLRVFDTVYRQDGEPTSLMIAARQAGARTAGGLTLLLHQGALSFERWFGRPAPLEMMRSALKDLALARPNSSKVWK